MELHLQLGLIFGLRSCDFSNALLLMVNALFVVANDGKEAFSFRIDGSQVGMLQGRFPECYSKSVDHGLDWNRYPAKINLAIENNLKCARDHKWRLTKTLLIVSNVTVISKFFECLLYLDFGIAQKVGNKSHLGQPMLILTIGHHGELVVVLKLIYSRSLKI